MRSRLLDALVSHHYYLQIKEILHQGFDVPPIYMDYTMDEQGILMYKNKIYVPENDELRKIIL